MDEYMIYVSLFVMVLVLGLFASLIGKAKEGSNFSTKMTLNANAKVIDFKQIPHRRKVGTSIETRVIFDDGYEYVTHKSQQMVLLNGVMTTREINQQILNEAYLAHKTALERYEERADLMTMRTNEAKLYPSYNNEAYERKVLAEGGWKCSACGKVMPAYVGTCGCGKSKIESKKENNL